MITVVGMGRKGGDLTMDGVNAIKNADVVVVKSQLTHMKDTVESLRTDVVYCDDIFEQSIDFDQLNDLILQRLRSFGKKDVVFCVVGDGSDDSAVQLLDKPKVICGVGLQGVVTAGNLQSGTVIYTAQDLLSYPRVYVQPTVIKCIDDKFVAGEVQLKLQTVFDNDTPVVFSCKQNVKQITLGELCKQRYDYQTTIYVLPKKLTERESFDYYDCVDVMDVLRGENGCPWDKEQTHKSIIKNVIEEAYELADALQKEDVAHTVEELGDLLMQVIFHLAIAVDECEFEPTAVYSALCRKLIDRHPHVFGNVIANNSSESLDVWNAQKQKEHKINNVAENLLDVPRGMSSLTRCQKVQSRASKGGYDFENIGQVVDGVKSELEEFLTAKTLEERQMEGGDLIFAVVNLLRMCDIDAETSVMLSTEKFTSRVVECERILATQGKILKQLTPVEFDELWKVAKGNVG